MKKLKLLIYLNSISEWQKKKVYYLETYIFLS